MSNITISVPDELRVKMNEHRVINWSEVARVAFEERIKDLDFLKEFKSKSELTKEDAIRLGNKIKEGVARRHGL